MATKHVEKIVFHDGNFAVERRFRDKKKPVEYLPVSTWGFEKNVTSFALVKRESENLESLDEPSNVVFYEIALSYSVVDLPLAKSIFVKTEKTRKILSESLKHFETYTVVFVKDMETGILHSAQAENCSGFPFSMVNVSKSRAKRVDYARAKELLDSGVLIGVFRDKELKEQVV